MDSSVKSRLRDIPIFSASRTQVAARHFNTVKVALLRLGEPQRIPLPSLRDLDLLLAADAWVCVDRTLNDVPVVAWTEFQAAHRDSLHKPIECERYMYHAHAPLIIERVFEDMQKQVAERMRR